ncbi:MAG: AAA family ATPase [Candidatus Acetothermia bacterium]|jgi:exonuclease SbcC|nr:AAA family ATPase [Candidatus Acetothermia bacterium]MDH7505566.1 AAA family ATPase [Candidatus Acetothermia bacterium]
MNELEGRLLDLWSKQAAEEERALRPASGGIQLLRLEVENVFCYQRAEVEFEPGLAVIAGPNGSGKSSLLESIFFALYGSRACPAMGRSLAEVLRDGARQGRVSLHFLCSGQRWKSEMGLKRQGERVTSERESCRLLREDGMEWLGVEEVTAQVQELLHMDRDDFTNAVYVRQGEIDRLIRAGEEERRGMLDRLLRLERLDSYATRAKEGAARAVNRRLAVLQGELAGLRRELAALEEEGLARAWAALEREVQQKEAVLAGLEAERGRLEEGRASLRERLRRLASAAKELQELELEREEKLRRTKAQEGELERLRLLLTGLQAQEEEQRAQLQDWLKAFPDYQIFRLPELEERLEQALTESRGELEKLRAEVQARRERLARLEAELGHLQKEMEGLDSKAYELRTELAAARELAQASEQELMRFQSGLTEIEAKAEALASRVGVQPLAGEPLHARQAAHLERRERAREQAERLRAELVAARTQRAELERELAEKEGLIEAGRCPTCGQPIAAATFADVLAELRQERQRLEEAAAGLEEEIGSVESQLLALEEERKVLDRLAVLAVEFQAKREQLEDKRQGLRRFEEQCRALEERLAQAEEELKARERGLVAKGKERAALTAEVEELSRRLNLAEEGQARLERLAKLSSELLRTLARLEEAEGRKQALLESLGSLREDLARLDRKGSQLRLELGERAKLEQDEAHLLAALKELEARRAALQREHAALLDRRGQLAGKLERLKHLQAEEQRLAGEVGRLTELAEEVARLEGLYRQVKGELRKRNVAAIARQFDHLFRLMDAGDNYSRALIDEGYRIEIELKDGRRIDPTIMSGGERALINIALRCAIHQVLARAVGPLPLILDEPTIYLDRERIQRLQLLLEELGAQLGQVLVVSHEESLVEGADHEYRTEKGPANISTVRRVR